MAKSKEDDFVEPDYPSYNMALDDVVKELGTIEANVVGPMPESSWLQVVRYAVEKLRKT